MVGCDTLYHLVICDKKKCKICFVLKSTENEIVVGEKRRRESVPFLDKISVMGEYERYD